MMCDAKRAVDTAYVRGRGEIASTVDYEFAIYLVDRCLEQVRVYGRLPDSDEARALFALANRAEGDA